MSETPIEPAPTPEETRKETLKHYRKIAIAVFSALAVGLGVYLDVIPISFITDLFSTK